MRRDLARIAVLTVTLFVACQPAVPELGSGARDVETLHRIDERLVRDEILAAGFSLLSETQLLRNGSDSRKVNVFKRSIRGRTDRFVLKFVKPPSY